MVTTHGPGGRCSGHLRRVEKGPRGTSRDWTRANQGLTGKVSGFPTVLVPAYSLLKQEQLQLTAQANFRDMCMQLMYVCMYGWMYVWMDGWMDGWMYVRMHACMYACMYVWLKVLDVGPPHVSQSFPKDIIHEWLMQNMRIYSFMPAVIYTYMHVHVHVQMRAYANEHVRTYKCIYMYIHFWCPDE